MCDCVEEASDLICGVWEFHRGSRQNVPIAKQGIHCAVLGNKIQAHDRNRNVADVTFGSASEIGLHGDTVDLG